MFSQKTTSVFAFLLFAALAVGCSSPKEPAGKDGKSGKAEVNAKTDDNKKEDKAESAPPKGTGPIARVNGKEIARAEYDAQVEKTQARFKRAGRKVSPELIKRLRDNLVRKFVDDALIAQAAETSGVGVNQDAVDNKLKEHRARFGNEKAFENFLKRTNQTEADIRRDLKKQLLRDALFEKKMGGDAPDEAAAKKYYEENQDRYKERKKAQASHILLKVKKSASAKEAAAVEKKAKKLLKQAKKKGADFAELARQNSEGPTAKKGGDLGKFSPGRMVKPFEDAVFNAKAGSVVGPVKTKFGYHVIKVFEVTPARQRGFAEVKDSILTSLNARRRSKAHREVMTQLRDESKIEILEPGVDLKRRPERMGSNMKGMGKGIGKSKRPPIDLKALQKRAKAAAAKAHDAPQ